MPTALIRTLAALAVFAGAGAARGDELDSVMYREPEVPVARLVKTYPKGLTELWLAALERPERDARVGAAAAIASAHERGMPGLAATSPALSRALEPPDEHPAVLAAVARALAVLDARDAAPAFLKLAGSGDPDLREALEPALAKWGHKPVRDLWLDRLARPDADGRGLLLAIRCLGAVREERAAARLRELTLSTDAAPPVRLAAARALGEVRISGSEADAERLAGDPSPRAAVSRLAAASLLRRHGGDAAIRLLQKLAADDEPAVAAVAVTRLAEIDPNHVVAVLAAVLASPDAGTRAHGVDAMFRRPSDEHVRSLARAMSDPHPAVRVRARRHLRELAGANRRAAVIDRASEALAGADWRGQEQAAILLAQLDHKPAAARLVELLKSERSEVLVAVGWALRVLAVAETLPKVLDHVRQRHADMLRSGPTGGLRGVSAEALDLHLSHLVQFLGRSRHRPADAALRALVPRFIKRGIPPVFVPVGPETRAAAIWALGLLHEGKPDEKLAELIEERLTGDGMFGLDDERVRRMAAVSLARMQARQSLPALREWSAGRDPSADVVANACRWAVGRLTGEPVPAAGTIEVPQRDWFLTPAR